AHFRLAQVLRFTGRDPEALAVALDGARLADGQDYEFIEHHIGYIYNQATLAAQLSRLLVDLRHDPRRLSLPPRVGFIRVPTPNGDNPLATFYYRLPAPVADATTRPARVLLLGPVNNEDPLEKISGNEHWTRFADAHGLVLLAPRLTVSERVTRAEHRFTHHRYAQVWSGEATLLALAELARRAPVSEDRLLLYGRGSGGAFVTHFAAWRPDLVAAVALSNGNWTVSRSPLPGLAPPEAQRGLAYWIGANPLDNHSFSSLRPRYAFQRELAERLRHHGANVEWTEWPSPEHTPSPDQEDAARAFLARQLSP
ncbi:MAG: hypothetical protein H7067_06695, partial [Burkholderiales bacterium]|nr:hypothetical protein [Opitutaceae bacterium]